uniref:Uncharacterized protein n=1 Tax=Ditylenchus dipsaci TaxID=166011 RepID=A0A915EK83_9BILA
MEVEGRVTDCTDYGAKGQNRREIGEATVCGQLNEDRFGLGVNVSGTSPGGSQPVDLSKLLQSRASPVVSSRGVGQQPLLQYGPVARGRPKHRSRVDMN